MHHGTQGSNEYLVAISSLDDNFVSEKEYKVIGDPLAQTSNMQLRQFSEIGILCGHAPKILDLMNTKSLLTKYIEAWVCEARSGTIQDKLGRE
jgi:hypothetical protein